MLKLVIPRLTLTGWHFFRLSLAFYYLRRILVRRFLRLINQRQQRNAGCCSHSRGKQPPRNRRFIGKIFEIAIDGKHGNGRSNDKRNC